ncbi:flagellar M-ring protein FliF [Variovorax boronicumulans]|uniref:flagellar basal-body MS-ring/collar protein FliF n=1 Tax=Variovorax boronicumulans TaxID=436515 RepID=UPI00277FC87B|nr:flagellar basal-body MS-ring/collar protein FliF [Variovorax boronicumulans]MDQ0086094.1 flagellar M-ring protein FliF [Variovorax boronicumulans]
MNFWQALTRRARIGFIGGALAIALATAAVAWWVFHAEYQALFTDLKPQDAQAMTTELERLKIPYRLGDSGTSILVDKANVHATRIKLMGKELPLQGAVGLELFNNTDFGMTEFAQKINYQRALQGELTRTIQSLSEVREVRVLLALPEQGLFKQATSKAKASITLTMRQGQALRAEQVVGVQRLVAAAVPGMATQDVTIVDGHGVALTRTEGSNGNSNGDIEVNGTRLELKRDTEAYLSRKVAALLDRSFGVGQALASVDVTLNMDQIRTTTEDVLPAATRTGLQATGVVVREREVLRDSGASLDTKVSDSGGSRSGSAQRDVEYAVGRRVEQVVSQPGSIRRIQVVAVVRKALDAAQEEQLRKVIAAAVGASTDRGDAVVVQSLVGGAVPAPDASTSIAGNAGATEAEGGVAGNPASAAVFGKGAPSLLQLLLGGLLIAVLAVLLFSAGRRGRPSKGKDSGRAPLSEAERAAALRRVRDWMREPGVGPAAAGTVGARGCNG